MTSSEIHMNFEQIVKERFATKSFDGKEISEEKIKKLFEIIHNAPSSFNIQPWKIIVIKDKALREKLAPVSWNQPQITSSSHLLVFCADTNIKENIERLEKLMIKNGAQADQIKGYIQMMRDFEKPMTPEQKLSWAQRQTYIALGNAVNGAKYLGFDSCPMEGFNPQEYAKILNLPANIVPSALVTLGYTTEKPRPKVRFPVEEVFMEK